VGILGGAAAPVKHGSLSAEALAAEPDPDGQEHAHSRQRLVSRGEQQQARPGSDFVLRLSSSVGRRAQAFCLPR